jgi:beta-phosphoglucomutase-like phosphatase (HAD superfamily)
MQDIRFASSEFLLCDADGCLFPSEQPAYDRSAQVMNALFAQLGIDTSYEGEELRRSHTGQSFRLTAANLSRAHGVDLPSDVLEHWVHVEKVAVTDHLSRVLRPDVSVQRALAALTTTLSPAVVTSSAIDRVGACLRATQLSEFFDEGRRYSAEDSLPVPISKPDPAIYLFAREQMRLSGTDAVVIEDSVAGVEAATGAGLPVVGLLHFVPVEERSAQGIALKAAGATAVAESWDQIVALLNRRSVSSGSR